jgi:hypothetical protein
MSFLRALFGPSKEEVWRELCRQTGADYVDGGFWKGSKVEARVDPWVVTLDTYTVSTGKSSITYTRLRAPYVNRDGFRFHIYRAGFFSEMGKAFGMQDVHVGDPVFDDAFIVKSEDETQVRRLLSSPRLRELFQAQPQVSLHVADDEGWFGPDFPEGVDELWFQTVGVIKDVDRLKRLFDLFSETLHQLCHVGSAYETDPFAPVDVPAADQLLRSSAADPSQDLLRPAAGGSVVAAESLLRPDKPPEADPPAT